MSKVNGNKDIIATDEQNEEVGLLANVLINKINEKKQYILKEENHIRLVEFVILEESESVLYLLTGETEVENAELRITNKKLELEGIKKQLKELDDLYKLINTDTEKALLISHAVNLIGG